MNRIRNPSKPIATESPWTSSGLTPAVLRIVPKATPIAPYPRDMMPTAMDFRVGNQWSFCRNSRAVAPPIAKASAAMPQGTATISRGRAVDHAVRTHVDRYAAGNERAGLQVQDYNQQD